MHESSVDSGEKGRLRSARNRRRRRYGITLRNRTVRAVGDFAAGARARLFRAQLAAARLGRRQRREKSHRLGGGKKRPPPGRRRTPPFYTGGRQPAAAPGGFSPAAPAPPRPFS